MVACVFSERNSFLLLEHQSLLFVNTCFFYSIYMFMYSFVQHVPHQSLLRFHFLNTLIHTILSISYHNVNSSSSYLFSNSVRTVAIHFAPASSLPRAAVGYSPASFFALSPLLIDRSRRKTLRTLQPVYHTERPRLFSACLRIAMSVRSRREAAVTR